MAGIGCFLFLLCDHHFHFPAEVLIVFIGGFTVRYILDKQAVVTGIFPSSPPVRAFIFILHRVQFFFPLHLRFSSKLTNSRSRAFCYLY